MIGAVALLSIAGPLPASAGNNIDRVSTVSVSSGGRNSTACNGAAVGVGVAVAALAIDASFVNWNGIVKGMTALLGATFLAQLAGCGWIEPAPLNPDGSTTLGL
jgi:hypothetical protein